MKILHLLSSTGVHGAETMALELARQQSELGTSCALALMQTHGDANAQIAAAARANGLAVHLIPCRGALDPRALMHLRQLTQAQATSVLHCHGYKPDLYGWAATLGRKRDLALVATCHNWLGRSANMRFYAALDKQVLRGFDAVAAVSAPIEAELARTVARAKIFRVNNGIDPARFAPPSVPTTSGLALPLGEGPVIGFVGRITAEKGVAELLQALALVRTDFPHACALIVGDGPDRARCEHLAAQLGIKEATHFLGTRSDTPALYGAMDIFVLPSYQEGFPMVILEAMAAALPIVATPVGEIAAMLDRGASGVVLASAAPQSLAAALATQLRQLCAQPDQARALGQRAQLRVQQHYSSHAMARAYLEVYRRVSAKK